MKSIITERQKEVWRLMSTGATNASIASELHISVKTVKAHLTAVYKGLGVKNRTQAAICYLSGAALYFGNHGGA